MWADVSTVDCSVNKVLDAWKVELTYSNRKCWIGSRVIDKVFVFCAYDDAVIQKVYGFVKAQNSHIIIMC